MKKIYIYILSIFSVIMLSACSPEMTSDVDDIMENGGAYEKEIDSKSSEGKELVDDERGDDSDNKLKIVSTYKLDAETDNFNDNLENIINKTHELGGYVSSNEIKANEEEFSGGKKKTSITLRVPKEKLPTLIEDIKEIVYINSETMNAIDMTDKYYDIEAKISNLIVREERLKELYRTSKNMSEILEVEKELANIEEKKEEEIRKKKKIDDRVKLARLDLTLKEVSKMKEENLTGIQKINKSIENTFSTSSKIIVGSIAFIISIIHFIALIILMIFIYKKYLKTYLIKKEQENNDGK